MASRPRIATLTNSSADILNAIRNSASTNYRDYVPYATDNADIIRNIGAILMDSPNLQNEFLNALVNRIGKVIVTSKMFQNPLAMFKKGFLEYGETIEEIFVEIAEPHQYDPETAVREQYKREIPDVRSAFHVVNYQKFYKVTIHRAELRKAFLNITGVTDLITRIIDSLYSGMYYDEFLMMKYLIAINLLQGKIGVESVPELNADNAKSIMTQIKGISNSMEFMKTDYNFAGVRTFTKKSDQFLIMNAMFDSTLDVEVLASAFNMDKSEFAGHKVMVDSFGDLDVDRLNMLLKNEEIYTNLMDVTNSEVLAELDRVKAVVVDRDWFMIYDNLNEMTEKQNAEGLYWNYWLHVWKILSASPFHNAVAYVQGTPSVTALTVQPTAITLNVGGTTTLLVSVETENFADKTVRYEVEDDTVASVSPAGLVEALKTGETTINVYALEDETITASVTVTVN